MHYVELPVQHRAKIDVRPINVFDVYINHIIPFPPSPSQFKEYFYFTLSWNYNKSLYFYLSFSQKNPSKILALNYIRTPFQNAGGTLYISY